MCINYQAKDRGQLLSGLKKKRKGKRKSLIITGSPSIKVPDAWKTIAQIETLLQLSRHSPTVCLMHLANNADARQQWDGHTICFTSASLCAADVCWPRCNINLQVDAGECVIGRRAETHTRASLSCHTVGTLLSHVVLCVYNLNTHAHAHTWSSNYWRTGWNVAPCCRSSSSRYGPIEG